MIVCAVKRNGKSLSLRWLSDLQQADRPAFRKLLAMFHRMTEVGRIVNRTKFKKLQGDLWEFKCSHYRIGCYQDRNSWILTHGFTKKRDTWPKTELARGLRIIEEDRSR
ncbi:MAG: type II toxin-antitoxin system RelE/ParE family toxin [Planctomycetota bacterium]